jgi:uncharacterized membrane protein YkgB
MGWYRDARGTSFAQVFEGSPHKLEQPLLGYLPYAMMLDLVPVRDTVGQLYAMRLLSVLLGVLITIVAWSTVVELFANRWTYIVGIMTFVVFLPMHSFLLGTLNSDHLAELFTCLVLFVLVRILHRGLTIVRLGEALVFAVLGAFAKRTALVTLPIIAAAVFLYLWRHRLRVQVTKKQVGLAAGALSLVGGLGFILWYQYSGMSQRALAALSEIAVHIYRYYLFLPSRQFPFQFDQRFFQPEAVPVYERYFVFLYRSFWGWFGWLRAPLSSWLYALLGAVSIAALVGLAVMAVRAREGRLELALWQKKTLALFAFSIVLDLLIVIAREIRSWDYEWGGYPQARFLFPVLVPIATLFFAGLLAVVPARYQRPFTLAYMLGFVVFDAYALMHYALPFFYG